MRAATTSREMTMPADEGEFLQEFHAEVEEELDAARSSRPADLVDVPPAEWLFDPTDVERQEVGLRNVLAAVEALESDGRPDDG